MKTHAAPCLFVVAISFALSPTPAGAASTSETPVGLDACAGDDAARLTFLTERLEGRRRYARNYMRGWLGFYTVGFGVSTYQAATEDDRGERAVDSLSAAKALFGIGRMAFWPPHAKDGAEGVFAAALPDGRAVALKIADGASRARPSVMVAALAALGVDTADAAPLVTQHVLGPIDVEFVRDVAIARCHVRGYHYLKGAPSGDEWMVAGHYVFALAKVGGIWKIREMTLEVFYQTGNRNLLGEAAAITAIGR